MSTRTGTPAYYCPHCKLETALARVCPKCHRRSTLVAKDDHDAAGGSSVRERKGPGRRREERSVSSAASGRSRSQDSARGTEAARQGTPSISKGRSSVYRSRPRLLVGLAIAFVVLVAAAVLTYRMLRKPDAPPTEVGHMQALAFSPEAKAALPAQERHFGAARPGQRRPLATPPRRCGQKYSLRVEALFAPEQGPTGTNAAGELPGTGSTRPAPAPTSPPGSPKSTTPGSASSPAPSPSGPSSSKRPESSVIVQTFLVTGDVPTGAAPTGAAPTGAAPTGAAPNIEWILMGTERTFRVEGKTLTVLRMDAQGALALDPKERKFKRLGPEDELAFGLRPGDLVGHALANLGVGPNGRLRVERLRRSEPMVYSLVHDTLAIVVWLTPRFPEPGKYRYTDSRPPPRSLVQGLTEVRRVFGEDRGAKDTSGADRRYLVEGTGQIASAPSGEPNASGTTSGKPGAKITPAKPGAKITPAKPGAKITPAKPGARVSHRVQGLPPVRLTGEVVMAEGALMPSRATMRMTGLVPGNPAAREISAELRALGPGCNR